jgi:hypothetical protein
MKKSKMMMGNLAESKELQNLMKQYPNHSFPVEIPEYNQSAYNFVGVRAKNSGLSQSLQIHTFCKSSADWMRLKDEFKTPQYLGNYHTVIMIHNPTIVAKPAVKPPTDIPKKKRVTPPVKKKIAAMLDDGASADIIAEELGLTVKQVENNI